MKNLNLHPLLKRRLRVISALFVIALACGILLAYNRNINRNIIDSRIRQLNEEITSVSTGIVFGTYDTQKVDEFIRSLNRQIKVFDLQKQVYKLILDRPELFKETEVAETIEKQAKLVRQEKRYRLDRTYMAFSYLDYVLYHHDPNFVTLVETLTKQFATYQFKFQQALNNPTQGVEPFYVYKGQIIGLQGCTGICTGTHLHLVTVMNGQVVDGCELLPKINLSIWGVAGECGVEDSKLIWPLYVPWILTQKFDTFSPVLKTPHRALDIIDRDGFPVRASHDGWYYPATRDCSGSRICNGGFANVATVCESMDCNTGLKTEYWHLSWIVD